MKNKIGIMGALLLALLVSTFAVSAATVTIRPDGQGAYSAWTNNGCGSGSSEWTCVDEITLNTSDHLSTNTQGAGESFTFSNLGIDPSSTINSVTLNYYGQRFSSTRFQVQTLIVSNGTNYTGNITTLNSSWGLYSYVYFTNPATGNLWTISEVDALQAGLRASTGSNRGGMLAQFYVVVDYSIDDTCTDTDGNVTTTFGNTSGFFLGNPYTNNDICEGTETVIENICSGTLSVAINVSCGTDGFVDAPECNGDDVWQNYTNYTCSGGACNSATTFTLKETCELGCNAGACIINNSCSDTDGGNVKNTFGIVSGYFETVPYEFNDTCTGDELLTEYFCSGSIATFAENVSCGTDNFSGSNFCSGGDVYRNFVNYSCGSGTCFNLTAPILQDDCGIGEACSSGTCVFNNTCFDADFGSNLLVASNVTGNTNGTSYTNFDVCLNASVVTEYTCTGTSPNRLPIATNLACNASTTCSAGRCV
jgi:hypothetical protein